MVLTVADARKLTVARLKEELIKRGLDSTGNKPDLLSRLTESIEQDAEDLLGDASGVSDHLLSDDILNDDILDAPSLDGDEDAEKLLGSVRESNTSIDEITEGKTVEEEDGKREVILTDKKIDVVAAEQGKRARAIRFGLPVSSAELTSENAKAARAKRFSLPEDAKRLSSDDAKSKRAERFGIQTESSLGDKLASRAARFGIPVSKAAVGGGKSAKLAARAKRFGGGVEDSEMEAKKKARLERFGNH